MPVLRHFVALLITTFSFFCSAVEVPDLYQFKVLVSDKSNNARAAASKQALLGVLSKVSGQAIEQTNPEIRLALQDISQFMLKFEYQDAEYGSQLLVVKFDPTKINTLLNELRAPIWGNRRPLVLIWLAVEDARQRELLTRESFPQLEEVLSDKANQRAVPIVLPLLDLEDRLNITVSDVWANFSEPVDLASVRYNPERIVTARIYKLPNQSVWQLDWRFTVNSEFQNNVLVGEQQQIIAQMIDEIALSLSSQYAVLRNDSAEQEGEFFIVNGINDFVQIEQAKRRLLSLSVVREVNIVSMKQGELVFSLLLNGTKTDLINTLSLDKGFKRLFDPLASIEAQSINRYQWIGE